MIAWMISFAFVIPLATISFMTLSISAALTFTFAAISLIFAHTCQWKIQIRQKNVLSAKDREWRWLLVYCNKR